MLDVGETERVQGVYAARTALRPVDALQLQDELDVFQRRQHGNQVVGLEYEADLVEPEIR